MAVGPGTRLGPYEIVAPLGAGGMGEVYSARDTRLDRLVAIKISREDFSKRFEREARTIAQLNHPLICSLYDVGPNYLVMELVEGQTLAEELCSGPLSLDQTIGYGAQIAEALAAAHVKGIVHRDLKPANIMVTKTGLKVLDFGLAKSQLPEAETITASQVVIGTPAYMAPEQLAAEACDSRTDIFALGLILYEMATGRRARAAQGHPVSMDGLPRQFAHVVQRCLSVERDARWQSAADVKAELEWSREAQLTLPSIGASTRTPKWIWPVAAVLFTGLVAASLWSVPFTDPSVGAPSQFALSFEAQMAQTLTGITGAVPVVAPDGSAVVFTGSGLQGGTVLWIRALSSRDARPIEGTEGGATPVWSPDSRWLAFYADGKIKKIHSSGGPSQTIAESPGFQDPAWGPSGDIIFRTSNREPLSRVDEKGGAVQPLTRLDESRTENSHRGPVFLPDGRRFLFTARCANRENNALYIGSLDSSSVTRVMPIQSVARYIGSEGDSPGSLLYYRDGGLVAREFDAATGALGGEARPVVDRIAYEEAGLGIGFRASRDGRVAIISTSAPEETRATWFDRQGNVIGMLASQGNATQHRISPDGARVAFTRPDPQTGNRDVWVIELARGVESRLTTNVANDWFPLWSPDGTEILFGSDRQGGTRMRAFLKKGLDANSEEVPFAAAVEDPNDWSRDGKWIAYQPFDVLIASAGEEAKQFKFRATAFYEGSPRFSPDGRWIAYVSNESGRYEAYVRPFAPEAVGAGGQIQISNAGGDFPVWRDDGDELYYMTADFTINAVSTKGLGRSVDIPLPTRLFRACPNTRPISLPLSGSNGHNFDTRDGIRFLVNCAAERPGQFTVLLNWPFARQPS